MASYNIDGNSTLAFDGSVGSAPFNPLISFANANSGDVGSGTLDLTGEGANEQNQFHGVVTNFEAGDKDSRRRKRRRGRHGALRFHNNTLYIQGADGNVVDSLILGTNAAGENFVVTENGNVDTITTTNTICFMAGTLIRTPDGEVAVEALKRGDLVVAADGSAVPVTWLGRQTISMRFADPLRVLPIRIKAGAIDENMPSRDLLLSPDHAVLVDGALISCRRAREWRLIVRETQVPLVFTYYHVEADDHALILAQNTPAETFVDNVERLAFDNWAEHEALYPAGKTIQELPYPRAKAHRQVPVHVRIRLAERAREISANEAAAA